MNFKVIFYETEDDAVPISQIVVADSEEEAAEDIRYIHPYCIIVSVKRL